MRLFLRSLFLCSILLTVGCKSSRQTTQNAKVDENGVMDITLSRMNRDAIRLKGMVLKLNGLVDKRNSYDFRVDKVLEYGATFSSDEPKVGEIVNLVTPVEVSFDEGQEIVVDVLTPKFGNGTKPMRVRLGQP